MGVGKIFMKIVWVENSFLKIPIGPRSKKINIIKDRPLDAATVGPGGVPLRPLLCAPQRAYMYTQSSILPSRAKEFCFYLLSLSVVHDTAIPLQCCQPEWFASSRVIIIIILSSRAKI